ncbi:hypothetical protein Bca101_041675 [Brassica carinata]
MTTPTNNNVSLKEAIAASISRGKLVSQETSFANPFWIDMIVIGKRAILNSRRQPELFGMRLGAVNGHRNHLSHNVHETRQLSQRRPRTSRVLRLRNVHNKPSLSSYKNVTYSCEKLLTTRTVDHPTSSRSP